LVYALPHAAFAQVRGIKDDTESEYWSNPFANTILIDTSHTSDRRMFGAYFGYTGSVLVSAYSFRYPDWFLQGLSQLFAASQIRGHEVEIGTPDLDRTSWLASDSLIPVKTLLRSRRTDPQFADPKMQAVYGAESWLLVHLIMIEKQYQTQFTHYLDLLDQGNTESEAFASSFTVSYEVLDKLLRDAVNHGSVRALRIPVADDPDSSGATALSETQSTGRLALIAVQHSKDLDAARGLVNAALRLDADNEDALAAQATLQMRQLYYSAALTTGNRLCAEPALSRAGQVQCAQLFAALSAEARRNRDALDMDAATLAARAHDYYSKAIDRDPADIASWSALTELLATTHNVEEAKTLFPMLKKIQLEHSHNGELARTLSDLCATLNDDDGALQYALVWQRHALDSGSRAAAAAYVSRLVERVQRKAIEAPGTAH
jgi:tetratricopeptide (TPR) repeat protein